MPRNVHPDEALRMFEGHTGPARQIIWQARLALSRAEELGRPLDFETFETEFMPTPDHAAAEPVNGVLELIVSSAEHVISEAREFIDALAEYSAERREEHGAVSTQLDRLAKILARGVSAERLADGYFPALEGFADALVSKHLRSLKEQEVES